jgi:predicted 3-demethylubiquinone-9 3-methyltransferase (glyoxalase superfamily)
MQNKITPCLWFDNHAEEAVAFYLSIFPGSRIISTTLYPESDQEHHQGRIGSVMAIDFELFGQPYMALNGGPFFKLNEALSLQVHCDTQEEIDTYWDKLREGGDEDAQQCGWLKDKFGLSWQILPTMIKTLFQHPDAATNARVMKALLDMKKLDIAALQSAADQTP